MSKYVINGGKPLFGSVEIAGMKNAALPILYACVLVKGKSRIENLPDTEDIRITVEILRSMGAEITYVDPTSIEICTDKITKVDDLPDDLLKKLRASYYLLGAGLSRFGYAKVIFPGGCAIGTNWRPVDQHLKAFDALGGESRTESGYIIADKKAGLKCTNFTFDVVTVGGTINMMLASVFVEGLTVIMNAACEPHIVDLANFLNTCGADISGAGTPTIKIRGVKSLEGSVYEIAPDMIEAGTYMAAVAATGGKVEIKNVIPKHLESMTSKLIEMGITVEEHDDSVTVSRDPSSPIKGVAIKTQPYPGFPTDMQPQMCALMCRSSGTGIITEGIWSGRFGYSNELLKMGAHISLNGQCATVEGVDTLSGAEVAAPDLRGGAALVIAGLCAKGKTTVTEIRYIERGYDDMPGKLSKIGADIELIKD